jgi:rhodanese-related sulfurtransferase
MAVSRISKEDLKLALDGDEAARPVLADVRLKYAWEHSTLKLPGAVRIDPKNLAAAALARGRDMIVYDSDPDDITAVSVAVQLKQAGFSVRVLKGGLPGWVAANLPADTKDAVRAPTPPAPPPAAAPAPASVAAAAPAPAPAAKA